MRRSRSASHGPGDPPDRPAAERKGNSRVGAGSAVRMAAASPASAAIHVREGAERRITGWSVLRGAMATGGRDGSWARRSRETAAWGHPRTTGARDEISCRGTRPWGKNPRLDDHLRVWCR